MDFYMTHKSFFILLGNPFPNLSSSLHIQATTDKLSLIIVCFSFFFFFKSFLYMGSYNIDNNVLSSALTHSKKKKSFPIHVSLVSQSCSVVSGSLWTHGLGQARFPIHLILQARILKWVAVPFSRGSSKPRDRTQVSHITEGFFTIWVTSKAQIHATVCQLSITFKCWMVFHCLGTI